MYKSDSTADYQANALDDESLPDLASTVRKTGQHTHEELSNSVGLKEYKPRDGSITPPIKDKLVDTIKENDPFEPTFDFVGNTAAGAGTLVGDLTGSDGKDAPLQDTGLDVVGAQGKAISSLGGGVEGVCLVLLSSQYRADEGSLAMKRIAFSPTVRPQLVDRGATVSG